MYFIWRTSQNHGAKFLSRKPFKQRYLSKMQNIVETRESVIYQAVAYKTDWWVVFPIRMFCRECFDEKSYDVISGYMKYFRYSLGPKSVSGIRIWRQILFSISPNCQERLKVHQHFELCIGTHSLLPVNLVSQQ